MKNSFVLLLMCLFLGSINAQETYYPLVETDKTWHVVEGNFGNYSTFTYKVEGDTIINQENFQILYRSHEEFPVNWNKYGYIREDEDKKVYYYSFYTNDTVMDEPSLVYDFGAELFDTISITSFAYNYPYELEIVIIGIDSVLVGSEYRKRMAFSCEFYYENFWIEGIGSNNGLLEPGFYCYIVCPWVELLCVKEENNVIYPDEYDDGCYIVGVNENSIVEKQFLVYPNPAKEEIFLTTPQGEIEEFTFILYNLESEVVLYKKVLNFSQEKVNIENLKAGLYLYRITESSKLLQNGKIIIKN